jgi:hypothetical protein
MITIRYRMIGAAGLLLSVLPTAVLASVNKPTAEERAACMGDAMTLCITSTPNKARVAGVEDVPAQPAMPGAIR